MSVWVSGENGRNTILHNFSCFFEKEHFFKHFVWVQKTLDFPINGQTWQNFHLHSFWVGAHICSKFVFYILVGDLSRFGNDWWQMPGDYEEWGSERERARENRQTEAGRQADRQWRQTNKDKMERENKSNEMKKKGKYQKKKIIYIYISNLTGWADFGLFLVCLESSHIRTRS